MSIFVFIIINIVNRDFTNMEQNIQYSIDWGNPSRFCVYFYIISLMI